MECPDWLLTGNLGGAARFGLKPRHDDRTGRSLNDSVAKGLPERDGGNSSSRRADLGNSFAAKDSGGFLHHRHPMANQRFHHDDAGLKLIFSS
ncbi:hypothetical protein [Cyanobium sp. ULC082]